MFVYYFVNYFVRLRTNHHTLFTISPISVIFDSARNLIRNLPYRPLWHFVKIPIIWRERRNARWEKWLTRWFTKCHLYTSHFFHFANIFSDSHQFDDKCIAGFRSDHEDRYTANAFLLLTSRRIPRTSGPSPPIVTTCVTRGKWSCQFCVTETMSKIERELF